MNFINFIQGWFCEISVKIAIVVAAVGVLAVYVNPKIKFFSFVCMLLDSWIRIVVGVVAIGALIYLVFIVPLQLLGRI